MADKVKVYFWIDNGVAVCSTSPERAELEYGIKSKPLKTMDAEEFASKYNGIVRAENSELVFGYSEAEIAEQEKSAKLAEIAELKQKLRDTDYVAAKIAEGSATAKEYADVLKKRQAWRDRINELEA